MKAHELLAVFDMLDIEPRLLAALKNVVAEHGVFAEVRDKLEKLIADRERCEGLGFRNGWVSFPALSKICPSFDLELTDNQLSSHLVALGYLKHPGLSGGRTNNFVRPDNGKARLYVKPDHYTFTWRRANVIAAAYSRDQGFPPSRNP